MRIIKAHTELMTPVDGASIPLLARLKTRIPVVFDDIA